MDTPAGNITLSVTHYNRFNMVTRAVGNIISDPRIKEIIISDDHSTDLSWEKLQALYSASTKVKLIRNPSNLGMSRNKLASVKAASTDLVVVFDSDNIIDSTYLDALLSVPEPILSNQDIILCPEFARPQFNFKKWSGMIIDKSNISEFLSDPMAECQINCCNYVVHKKSYCFVFRHDATIKGTDTAYFAYLWLRAGGSFYIVPSMQYDHTIHAGSGWLQDANYNMMKGRQIKDMILSLCR